MLPVDQRKPAVFLKTPSNEMALRFSPDGRWIAYSSNESGASEIYVRPFPGPGAKLQVSAEGGDEPIWSRSGRELFYRQGNHIMSVPVSTQPALTAGSPRALFEGSFIRTDTGGAGYDVAADGRFLMVQPLEPEQPATHVNIVLNWFDELTRRGPAGK